MATTATARTVATVTIVMRDERDRIGSVVMVGSGRRSNGRATIGPAGPRSPRVARPDAADWIHESGPRVRTLTRAGRRSAELLRSAARDHLPSADDGDRSG